jgi:ABC-2 type transport system ATP-binding protein
MDALQWSKKRIEQLSKGMAQKVQFIVATIANPELVILDEPFSGLDPVNLELMRDIVLELREQGTTVIFSTHDMAVAQSICDHVLMIYQGKKVLDGTIDSIRDGYGGCQVKVRMAGGGDVPETIAGVTDRAQDSSYTLLGLESESVRSRVLESLIAVGDVEHFETVRPSLHDIFVKIAKPVPPRDNQDAEAKYV